MKKKLGDYLVAIAYVILTAGLCLSFLENYLKPWKVLFICLALVISFTVKELTLNLKDETSKLFYALIILDAILIFYLSHVTRGTSYKLFYFSLMYQCTFNCSFLFSSAASICFFAENLYSVVNNFSSSKYGIPLLYICFDLITFSLVFIILNLIKHIFSINKDLEEIKNSLSIKNLELELAYDNLKEAYQKNETLIMAEERNKLAREIHDTVGHTLTTALVEMEACSTLLSSDPSTASTKMGLAIGQVRKGLREMRNSVRSLSSPEQIDYENEIINLINNTITHSGVTIRYDIEDFQKESENIRKCIYRSLQEGLTNGIRHGKATAFIFKVKYLNQDTLTFSLLDNGSGCSQIKKGFGLKIMEERVEAAHGKLSIINEKNEGFNIFINFNVEGN